MSRLRPRRWGACVLIALLAAWCLVLSGCGLAHPSASSSTDQGSQQMTPQTTISVLCSTQLKSPLAELEQLYASEHTDIAFSQDAERSDKALLKDLSDSAAEAKAAARASASTSSAEETKAPTLVFGLSSDSMAHAASRKLVEKDSQTDLVADSLVIVAGKNSKAKSVTTQSLLNGDYALVLAAADTDLGKLQTEALIYLGVCSADGRLIGSAAKQDNVWCQGAEGPVFATLSNSKHALSLVKKSDVYRFGGVKIVGDLPKRSYEAPLYQVATTTTASDEQVKAAEDFRDWCVTDADAIEVWEKWGFTLATEG